MYSYRKNSLVGHYGMSIYWCLGNWLVHIFIAGDWQNAEMPEVVDSDKQSNMKH
jgi:hypothetical protein